MKHMDKNWATFWSPYIVCPADVAVFPFFSTNNLEDGIPGLGDVVRITPIYKPKKGHVEKGPTTFLGGVWMSMVFLRYLQAICKGPHNPRNWGPTITMVINHVSKLTGMIRQEGPRIMRLQPLSMAL